MRLMNHVFRPYIGRFDVVYAEEGDTLELNPLLSIQKCIFISYIKTHIALSPAESESITPKRMESRPYHIQHHPMNLRTNSFLEGENDGYLKGYPTQFCEKTSDGSVGGPLDPLKNYSSDCLLYTSDAADE